MNIIDVLLAKALSGGSGGEEQFYDLTSAYEKQGSWEYIDGQAIRDMFAELPAKIKFHDEYFYISWAVESTTTITECGYTSGMSDMSFSEGGSVRIRVFDTIYIEDLGNEVMCVVEEKYYWYDNDTDKYTYDPMGN